RYAALAPDAPLFQVEGVGSRSSRLGARMPVTTIIARTMPLKISRNFQSPLSFFMPTSADDGLRGRCRSQAGRQAAGRTRWSQRRKSDGGAAGRAATMDR